MNCTQKITQSLTWIGGNDRRLALFENVYPIPAGVSYNSYFLDGEETAVLDTVDASVSRVYFENLAVCLQGRKLTYCVIHHMEPDHAATVEELLRRYPEVTLVGNAKTVIMLHQFFNLPATVKIKMVAEGDTLTVGAHTLTFYMAPMVHWPEVMMSYDSTDGVLFSADAFGTFGALSGNLFADTAGIDHAGWSEICRYYTNIVGKYGTPVQAVLKKAAKLDIRAVCPLHGPVWRTGNEKADALLSRLLSLYDKWSRYEPEEKSVLIAYASVYGDTANAAEVFAARLAQQGIENIAMYDVSVTHPSYLIAEAFRRSHIVLASTTYNAGIFVNMENFLHDLAAHALKNRKYALVENGSWAPTAGNQMNEILQKLPGWTHIGEKVTIRSSLQEAQLPSLLALADAVAASVND